MNKLKELLLKMKTANCFEAFKISKEIQVEAEKIKNRKIIKNIIFSNLTNEQKYNKIKEYI